jgi:hypothetical protein
MDWLGALSQFAQDPGVIVCLIIMGLCLVVIVVVKAIDPEEEKDLVISWRGKRRGIYVDSPPTKGQRIPVKRRR